jgi:predicted GTPase
MARGLFITGFTVSEVLAIQRRAKELLLEGKTIMNWNDADTSVAKQFTMAVDQVLEECGHALRVLDPATYGRPRVVAVSFISGYLPK